MAYTVNYILLLLITVLFTITNAGCTNKPAKIPSNYSVELPSDQTIIEQWNMIPIPPAPELKSVMVATKTTALLILDMQSGMTKLPRCADSLPKIKGLLTMAHGKNMLVIYSITSAGNFLDITSQLAPSSSDPIVRSGVDKFYNTNLESILQKAGIKTVIITGTAANGAVLHTAVGAALRGFHVILPVDAMSAENPYAEQYTAWHMVNSPGTKNRVTLTKISRLTF